MIWRNWCGGLILIALASVHCFAATDTWHEVKSPNFTIVTNASAKEARRVAKSFEQFRAVFQKTLPTMRVDPGFPITVFAARDAATFQNLLPRERLQKGVAQPSGLFLPFRGKTTILLRVDIPEKRRYHALYHEYVHMAMDLNFESLPLWLFEGLADFYGFARIDNGESGVGLASREYINALKAGPLIPLSTLLEAGRNSPYYLQPDKSRIFYAQSWALTHFLAVGDKGARARQLIEFLRLIQRDVPGKDAFVRCFGALDALQQNLESYIRQEQFYFYPVKAEPAVKESRYTERRLSRAEALALQGELLVRVGRADEAGPMLEEALLLEPRSAAVHEATGLLHLRLRDLELSQKHFTTAAELDSGSCLAQYYAAELAYARNRDFIAAEGYLRKALAINRQFVPACRLMSHVLMLQGAKPAEALEYALKAAELEPAEPGHWIAAGEILLVMARDEEARQIGERLMKRARNQEEYARAEALLAKIKRRSAGATAAPPKAAGPSEEDTEEWTPLGR